MDHYRAVRNDNFEAGNASAASRDLGWFQLQRRRFIAVALLLAAVSITLVESSSEGFVDHEYVEAVGIGLILIGILGRLWCTLYIGGSKSSKIVKSGPYSITRNPLYFFSAIASAGVGAQSGSIVLAGGLFIACALAFRIVIWREERHLGELFGKEYFDYVAEVPRFFPKFSLFYTPSEIMVFPSRLYSTFVDGLVFFIAVPYFELIEWLQGSGWIAPLIELP